MKTLQLTAGAIECYLNGNPPNDAFLQVINIKKFPNSSTSASNIDKYRMQVSDSIHYQPCLLVSSLSEKVSNGEIDRYCVINIREMIPTNIQGKRILLIKDLSVCQLGSSISQVIGNPSSLELRKAGSDPLLVKQSTFPNSSDINQFAISSNTIEASYANATPKYHDVSMESSHVHTRISPITVLNPYNSNWMICARVTTKHPLRKWSNSKGEGQVFSFEMTDSSAVIRVTAFNEFATDFDSRIHLNKVYFLSKADMRPANKKFSGNSNHEFELYINSTTQLEESLSDNNDIPSITYNFTMIEDIKLLPKDTQVDIIGICVEIHELVEILVKTRGTHVHKRDIILADKSKLKIHCTLWGIDAENFSHTGNPVILIRSAKVSDFNTCSLSMGSNSSMTIDPDMSIARELNLWYENEGKLIDLEVISAKSSVSGHINTFSDIFSAKSLVSSSEKGDTHTFRAMISLFKKDKEILYFSCPTEGCQKKVFKDDLSSLYRCDKCNLEFPNFKYRYMVSIEIEDHSGSTWVTCFKESESILGITAEELGKSYEVNGKSVIDASCDSKLFSTFYFTVRLKQESFNDESRIKGIVLAVSSTDNVLQDCKILLNKIHSFTVGQ